MITTLSSGEARENERDRERDKERAPRGSKSVYLLCVVQVAISVFGDASLVGLKHCRDLCATTKSARDLLFCHSLKHTYANCQTIKAATGGIFHCHCQHPPSHTHNHINGKQTPFIKDIGSSRNSQLSFDPHKPSHNTAHTRQHCAYLSANTIKKRMIRSTHQTGYKKAII